jgi:2-dehydropantoate 2-reductase
MRFVVYGAGAIGGVVGARLHQAGHDVTLVARGAHHEAIERDGLVLDAPDGRTVMRIPVVSHPGALAWDGDPVVLLAVKGQHTEEVLEALVGCAPPSTPIVCAQNGVDNERQVLRWFPRTYGMCVMCATTHLRPGHVEAHYGPVTGLLDLGRFPGGEDDCSRAVAAALSGATFGSESRPDIMRWKRQKLLMNLANSMEALCGPGAARSPLAKAARAEGEMCLRAAGLEYASLDEDADRRRALFPTPDAIGSVQRVSRSGGGSTWQSLARGADSVEVGYLNGEIVLLGRLHEFPTPINELLQRHLAAAVRLGSSPGSVTVEQLQAELDG